MNGWHWNRTVMLSYAVITDLNCSRYLLIVSMTDCITSNKTGHFNSIQSPIQRPIIYKCVMKVYECNCLISFDERQLPFNSALPCWMEQNYSYCCTSVKHLSYVMPHCWYTESWQACAYLTSMIGDSCTDTNHWLSKTVMIIVSSIPCDHQSVN